MRGVGKSLELIFVTIFAGVAADVIAVSVGCRRFGRDRISGARRTASSEPDDRGQKSATNQQRFKKFDWTQLRPPILRAFLQLKLFKAKAL